MSTNFMLILKLVIFMRNKKTVFIFVFFSMNLININNELQLCYETIKIHEADSN